MPARVLLQDFTGVPCVVDLAAMRDGIVALGGDPQKVNPLQPVELVIDHSVQVDHFGTRERARAQRRARIPAQSRALRVPALGADGVPQLPRRAARDRHRPSGQHRVPRARRVPRRRGRRRDRLSRHGVRHRLAHDDGERPGRGRLGRRRHRGRGRDARPAELDADSAGARLSADRQAARRRDGHRSRADDHRSAPQERRRRQVRRVLRPGPGAPDDCRSRDARQHVSGVRRHGRDLPDRRHDARLPAPHRPRRDADRARRGLRQSAGPVPDRATPDAVYSETMELDLVVRRAEPCRPAPAAGSRVAVEGEAVVRRGADESEEGREGRRRRRRWCRRRHGRRSSSTARS